MIRRIKPRVLSLDIIIMGLCQDVCFSLDDVRDSDVTDPNRAFLLACEHQGKYRVIRHYHCFPSFQQFLEHRDQYPHCHELLAQHSEAKPDLGGRLVFDFDIPNEVPITDRFNAIVQRIVQRVLLKYYHQSQPNRLQFVWSSSPNPNKISRHLTVKHCYFSDWNTQSKQFYQLFRHTWIRLGYSPDPEAFVDAQIIRKHGSLRMVGSSKIGGSRLILDHPDRFTLEDSLIRIYRPEVLQEENVIDPCQLNLRGIRRLRKLMPPRPERCIVAPSGPWTDTDVTHPDWVYRKMFQILYKQQPGCFCRGKIKGPIMRLTRLRPAPCTLSGKIHDSDNAQLVITQVEDTFEAKYVCFRNCAPPIVIARIAKKNDL